MAIAIKIKVLPKVLQVINNKLAINTFTSIDTNLMIWSWLSITAY